MMSIETIMMRLLRIASVCALLALALMVWGVLDPSPIALVVAMSVGQALGTLSFALYALVVIADLRHAKVFGDVKLRFGVKKSEDSAPKEP
jgi:peptidoglycan/LPS O-acetylase OafA/YrhL